MAPRVTCVAHKNKEVATLGASSIPFLAISFSFDPDPGIKSRPPVPQADSLPFEPPEKQSESVCHSVVSDSLWSHGL